MNRTHQDSHDKLAPGGHQVNDHSIIKAEDLSKDAPFVIKHLHLHEDFYALTFICYLKSNSTKLDLSRRRQSAFLDAIILVWST